MHEPEDEATPLRKPASPFHARDTTDNVKDGDKVKHGDKVEDGGDPPTAGEHDRGRIARDDEPREAPSEPPPR
jgi:hypothetical protein